MTNLRATETRVNRFLTARKPVWRLNRPYLNCNACTDIPVSAPASQSCITTKLPIKLYISNTTTLIHGQKQSGNKFKQDLTNCQDHRQDCSFLSNSTWLVHKPAYQAVLHLRNARNRLVLSMNIMFSHLLKYKK